MFSVEFVFEWIKVLERDLSTIKRGQRMMPLKWRFYQYGDVFHVVNISFWNNEFYSFIFNFIVLGIGFNLKIRRTT